MKSQKQQLSILGATGSIGQSTLDLVRLHSDKFAVFALSGFRQVDKLFELCQEFHPKMVCVADDVKDEFAKKLAHANLNIDIVSGQDGLCQLACAPSVDKVVAGIVGASGLASTLSAVKAGKTLLLANKESLVMAGDLVMKTARQTGAKILPIDSEHNAIFQCLPSVVQADNANIDCPKLGIKKLWLTASGGGFLHKSYDEMKSATVAQAVKHPNWSMGQKISIDSATMMNKGLELIEACHLFGVGVERVAVAIHPQSVVHSLVEYVDGSMLAQCGTPDMKTPISYALAYPDRVDSGVKPLNLFEMSALEFIVPDEQKFACLALAKQAMALGNGACIILNGANEVAVDAFLKGKIKLTDIAVVVEKCLNADELAGELTKSFDDLVDILALDNWVREIAKVMIDHI